jgi:hypothetical protein
LILAFRRITGNHKSIEMMLLMLWEKECRPVNLMLIRDELSCPVL